MSMKINSHIKKALDVLKKSPLKLTTQRTRLIEILFKDGDQHFTAEEVYKEVNRHKYKISLATIYNCLNQFTKHEILKPVRFSNDKVYFDTNTERHHHFFCKSTEKLSDIKSSDVKISNLPKIPRGKKLESVEVVVNISDWYWFSLS